MNKLSFRRIKALMKYEITSDARSLFYILGSLFVFEIIISAVFYGLLGQDNWIVEGSDNWIMFGSFMLTTSLTARYLRPTQTRVYLTLPGSPLEKFVAHISIYILVTAAIVLVRFGLVELSTLFYETEISAKDLLLGVSLKVFDRFEDVWVDHAKTFSYYTHVFNFMIFAIIGIVVRRLRGPLQKVVYYFCMIFLFFGIVGSETAGLLDALNLGKEFVPFMPLFIVLDIFLGWLLYRSICKVQAK